jgi:hypothetical protein
VSVEVAAASCEEVSDETAAEGSAGLAADCSASIGKVILLTKS